MTFHYGEQLWLCLVLVQVGKQRQVVLDVGADGGGALGSMEGEQAEGQAGSMSEEDKETEAENGR